MQMLRFKKHLLGLAPRIFCQTLLEWRLASQRFYFLRAMMERTRENVTFRRTT